MLSRTAIRSAPRLSSLESGIVSSARPFKPASTGAGGRDFPSGGRDVAPRCNPADLPCNVPANSLLEIRPWPRQLAGQPLLSGQFAIPSAFLCMLAGIISLQFPAGSRSSRRVGVSAPRADGIEPAWVGFLLAVSLKSTDEIARLATQWDRSCGDERRATEIGAATEVW